MAVWPFKPRDGLVEVLEWKTDIIRSKTTEQRLSIRSIPRISYQMDHVLSEQEYHAARAIIRQNSALQVPDWTRFIDVSSLDAGSTVLVNFNQEDINLQVGDSVLIWSSSADYEVCIIDAVDSNGVTVGSVLLDYSNPRLLPLYSANAPIGLQSSRGADRFPSLSITFELTESIDLGHSDYSQYRGHDVIDDCPIVASERFSEPLAWLFESIDNEIAPPIYSTLRDIPDARYMMRWHPFTRSELAAIRYFLYSRRGRWKSFWLSSYARDFELAATIGASDNTITVYAPRNITDLGFTTFDIDIYSSAHYYRQVNSYAIGSELNGRQTLTLSINTSLGVSLSSVDRISYFRCLRFDADRIELHHQANAGTTIAIPCLEVSP